MNETKHIEFMISLNTEQKQYFKQYREKLIQHSRKLINDNKYYELYERLLHCNELVEILFGED